MKVLVGACGLVAIAVLSFWLWVLRGHDDRPFARPPLSPEHRAALDGPVE